MKVEAKELRIDTNFQTPVPVAAYMASLLPNNCGTILEPTPGMGNLVREAEFKGTVIAPARFEDLPVGTRYDYAVMNPPFTPMKEGYRYLTEVMDMTDNIVALLPWFIVINSDKRMQDIKAWGLVSVTNLPRKTFPGTRIQCCILELKKGYQGETTFKTFTW